jgi:uncharacterized protein Veg
MKKAVVVGLLIMAFSLGWFMHDTEIEPETEMPYGMMSSGLAPYDWVEQGRIHVYPSHIRIELKNAVWANFTNTHSMIPILSSKSNAIQIKPAKETDKHIGDIISFKTNGNKKRIIHRVIGVGLDEQGWFCLTKGDNNKEEDPFKIRFKHIERVVVAVIY